MKRKANGLPTSFVDITFILVFMFLLLSTLANTTQQEAKERSLPPINLTEMGNPENQSGSTQVKAMVITVAPGPKFFVDSSELPLSQLQAQLVKRNPPEVELRGDNAVPYGELAKVLKICTEAGIHNVALTFKSTL